MRILLFLLFTVAHADLCARLLSYRGYEPSVAARIAEARPALIPRILLPFGRPGYVTRGLCVAPEDFDPTFKPRWRMDRFPHHNKIYVAARAFGSDGPEPYACPGGLALELQIPQFLFTGFTEQGSYRENGGHWGYLRWQAVRDLSPFITRVELRPLDGSKPIRISYEEFLKEF